MSVSLCDQGVGRLVKLCAAGLGPGREKWSHGAWGTARNPWESRAIPCCLLSVPSWGMGTGNLKRDLEISVPTPTEKVPSLTISLCKMGLSGQVGPSGLPGTEDSA